MVEAQDCEMLHTGVWSLKASLSMPNPYSTGLREAILMERNCNAIKKQVDFPVSYIFLTKKGLNMYHLI